MQKKYLPRIADRQLSECLERAGAVNVVGPKWCGKTETSLQQAASALFLQDPDEAQQNIALAEAKPSLLLRGEQPRLIDEWQDAPQLWDAARYAIDREGGAGHYIFTGSASPVSKPRHSGTGRFARLEMRPMSLFESGDSSAEVSLTQMFSRENIAGSSEIDVESLAEIVCRGGWPEAVLSASTHSAIRLSRDYIESLIRVDVPRMGQSLSNAQYARLVLQAYSRCISTQTPIETIRRNIKHNQSELARSTVDAYLSALRSLYIIDELPAWAPSLHARSRIASTPTRHLTDPSLAVASLGASPELLLRDMSTYGMLFESLCVRDLRVYVNAMGGHLLHYRDNTGLEADAVAVLDDGRWGLFEMKMTNSLIDEGAAHLLKLAGRIDATIMGEPSFLAVITPQGYAFKRADGVLTIPIGCLAP